MDTQMFCFQCEQTVGGKGCMGKAGVCGKKADIAGLQDQLTGALIGLARAMDSNAQPTESAYKLLIKGLFTTITNVNFNGDTIKGTATVTNGVPVFAGTGETWFTLTVTVTLSSDPVEGATVMINGNKQTTNADGEASFSVCDGETYVLGAYDSSSHDASEVFTAASGTTTKTVAIS